MKLGGSTTIKVNCLEPHPQLPYICTSGLDWDVKVWIPLNEKEPEMKQLAQTIKENNKSRVGGSSEVNENQMSWMLWRHVRTANRVRRVLHIMSRSHQRYGGSSSSCSSTNDEDDDDDIGNSSGCSTS